MKKTMIITGLMALLALSFVAGCSARKPQRPPEDKIGRLIEKLSESLSLTEAQKAQVETIKNEIKEKNDSLREARKNEGKEVDEAFRNELSKDKFDASVINKLLDSKSQKREDQRRFMVSEMEKFHTILTAEQKQKLAGLMRDLAPEPPKEGEPQPPRKEEKGAK